MLFINKTSNHEVVDYAAHELKKYLRMMQPGCGDVKIAYAPDSDCGFRIGLMQDFGLDVSDVKEPELDDILYIDTTAESGIIAGDNPRSVLLAVYAFLRENGCRWLFPGVDGEYIPLKEIQAVRYRHVPSCRYRGPCIEGACSQQVLLETIDFIPKMGMNLFQMQFLVPTVFYKRHYEHEANKTRAPEPVSNETMLQWKSQCEVELARRGIEFHDVGHGWTVAPFGVDTSYGWKMIDNEHLSDDAKKYLALYDGKRSLYKGVALNTQFCMSSTEARKKVASYIAEYSAIHSNVDYLHVWLGDSHDNHCECEACVQKTVSDWYVMLLNDIDEALSAKGLNTRIVFIEYAETIWAPQNEKIRNADRFALMLAPIARSYTRTMTDSTPQILPFERNHIQIPRDLDTYMAYFKEWRKTWKGACLSYEYHFWRHQIADPSGMLLAKRIYEDIECYKANGIDGLIACGSQRSYFPTGFAYYVFARKQYDLSLSFEDILKEYFLCAFGSDWKQFADYLYEIADCFGDRYLEGEESADVSISKYYHPERAAKLRGAEVVLKKGFALIRSHYNSADRVRTASVRMLEEHAGYFALLAKAFTLKAEGNNEGALNAHETLQAYMDEREIVMEKYFPHHTASWYLEKMIKS
ncbi:MAG: DUF4838 domain-containing protein [Clostridiales bacterium]|nr:DUF4838 domain-containing protein [Clostridiales bacterium]